MVVGTVDFEPKLQSPLYRVDSIHSFIGIIEQVGGVANVKANFSGYIVTQVSVQRGAGLSPEDTHSVVHINGRQVARVEHYLRLVNQCSRLVKQLCSSMRKITL